MTKRKFKVPHTLVILFGMVVLAQILTYVIPAGPFVRDKDSRGSTGLDKTGLDMERMPGGVLSRLDTPASTVSQSVLRKGLNYRRSGSATKADHTHLNVAA